MPSFIASTEVDFSSNRSIGDSRDAISLAHSAHRQPKGGESLMPLSHWIAYLRARFNVQEGQTMAEYGVVLAVIALGVLVAFTALSGGITKAIDKVTAILG